MHETGAGLDLVDDAFGRTPTGRECIKALLSQTQLPVCFYSARRELTASARAASRAGK